MVSIPDLELRKESKGISDLELGKRTRANDLFSPKKEPAHTTTDQRPARQAIETPQGVIRTETEKKAAEEEKRRQQEEEDRARREEELREQEEKERIRKENSLLNKFKRGILKFGKSMIEEE